MWEAAVLWHAGLFFGAHQMVRSGPVRAARRGPGSAAANAGATRQRRPKPLPEAHETDDGADVEWKDDVILRPGQIYRHTMIHRFTTEQRELG